MTDPVIERLRSAEDRVRRLTRDNNALVMLNVTPRILQVRMHANSTLTDIKPGGGLTIDEALCEFERNLMDTERRETDLARTLGLEAAE